MATYVYPTNFELNTIARDKEPNLTGEDLAFQIMPIERVNASKVKWRQKDNYKGLQQLRGMNGQPASVQRVGEKEYEEKPGIYGEFTSIDEMEMTDRAAFGSLNAPVSIDDLVMDAQDQLLERRYSRMRYVIWKLLVTGTFSVSLPHGAGSPVAHTSTYTIQTYSASDWSTVATATPLADFRGVQLLGRGRSVKFEAASMAIMNRVTANRLLSNTNANDLAGKRTDGLANILSIPQANALLTGEGLPMIVIYDEGYIDDNDTFQLFIPDDKVVVVGQRPAGQRVGEIQVTRNANNPGLEPDFYQKVVDKGEDQVPRQIDVHDGGNWGPALYFPSAIVVMSV